MTSSENNQWVSEPLKQYWMLLCCPFIEKEKNFLVGNIRSETVEWRGIEKTRETASCVKFSLFYSAFSWGFFVLFLSEARERLNKCLTIHIKFLLTITRRDLLKGDTLSVNGARAARVKLWFNFWRLNQIYRWWTFSQERKSIKS